MSEDVQTEQSQTTRRDSNPYTLWFVVLSFIAPVALAYYMFYFGEITSFTNNGDFVQPGFQIEVLGLEHDDGEVFTESSLARRWHIFAFVGSDCSEACQKHLINMRQMKRAVKRPHKLRYSLVSLEAPTGSLKTFIGEKLAHVVRLRGDQSRIEEKLSDLIGPSGVSAIYLFDPAGNAVMSFSEQLDPTLAIKDMNRLF